MEGRDGDWGLYPDLRNAVYISENELGTYYSYYNSQCNQHLSPQNGGYTGVDILGWNEFLESFTTGPYRPVAGEHYTFMGWYEVKDGKVSSMPFNFNDPVTGPLELRAKWRLDGGYYIQYNPYYFTYDNQQQPVVIIGEIDQWTDPAHPQQLYADQSPTQILRAPTNVSSTDTDHTWAFRGWRVVRATGDTFTFEGKTYTNWEPIELVDGNPVYYQPGEHFTIDSALATGTAPEGNTGHIIYMQAYYEPEERSERRPEITNLILDANDEYGGYVNESDSGALPDLDHPGTSAIKTDGELYNGHPTQILFGDIQSNLAVHLFRYATTKTVGSETGTNFFTHENGYKLIGFDKNANPEYPTTNHAYVPAYAADSVISVTRNEIDKTLYAMWEPMVYVTFVNKTGSAITVNLSGTSTNTVRIVNKVTGEFGREVATSSISVPEGESVKIVLPAADVTQNEEITATVFNDHVRKKISVNGVLGQTNPYGTGSTDIKYGNDVTYRGTLVSHQDGIVVTYAEEDDAQILYDVNGGTWTDECPPYQHLSGDIYDLDTENLHNNQYEPTDPTHPDMLFIGWTIYPEIAAIHDFSSTDPLTVDGNTVTIPTNSIQLDVVRDNYLWDFSENASELYNNEKILYAVWSETATVTFNVAFSTSLNANPLVLYTWTGPETTSTPGPYVFYRSSETDPYITYTVAKGEKVSMPDDPTPTQTNNNIKNAVFMYWLIKNAAHNTDKYRYTPLNPSDSIFASTSGNIFDFTQRITADTEVVTSWTTILPQTFTFTIKNEVVNGNPNDEFDYTLSVVNDYTLAKMNVGQNEYGHPTTRWGSVTTKLKNNEEYTVTVSVYKAVGKTSTGTNITWDAYSTEIKVTDRNGTVIKNDKLFYCKRNSVPDYVGDYKYSLEIVQSAFEGYTTTVLPDDDHKVGNFVYTWNDNARMFEFGSTRNVNNPAKDQVHGNTDVSGEFRPERNVYVADEHNSLTVIFHNERDAVVARTGFTAVTSPFVLMLLAGLLLLVGIAVPAFVRKRRHVKAEACEAVQINYPGTMPPCPRANLWAQPTGTSGKRGGTV